MDEPSEFERLVLDRLDSLYSYALALTRRDDDADDLLQDSLARAFERFRLYDRSFSFSSWIFTILRRTHIDRVRKRRSRGHEAQAQLLFEDREATPESPLYAIPLDPEALLVRQETAERLRDGIRRLPPEMREVVELRDIEGLSYQEIAAIVGRPVGTVMSRLYRGRNLLRACLVQQEDGQKGAETRRGL